jgi:MFS family permease
LKSTSQPVADTASPGTVSLGLMIRALLPFGLGYFLSYLVRAVNAVVAPDLVAEIGLSASELGLLTAAYLFAFACFQLPLGLLLDRYGPRRVQIVLLTVAALGAALFAAGSSTLTLTAARALIGIGFAGGLMSGFKAVVLWVPEPRRALANSYVMSLGALGLLCATSPMEWAVQSIGWRHAFVGMAAITFMVALLIVFLVPERNTAASGDTLRTQVSALGSILGDRAFWGLAPLLAATAGYHIAIQTLWAGPWFHDVAGLDRMQAANHLFLMAAAFFVGILVTGAIADWFVRRGFSELDVMLGFLVPFLISQLCIILNVVPLRQAAWMTFGMSGQVAILAYPWLSKHFGAGRSGRANTAMNLIIFAAAFFIQSGIGAIIGMYPRLPSGGYGPEAYQMGFGVFLVIQLVALIWYLRHRALFQVSARQGAG